MTDAPTTARYNVYGTSTEAPMKVRFKDAPLPEDVNREAEEKAGKLGYPKLVEVLLDARKHKRYGAAQFYLNGIEIAKFDYYFGMCTRFVIVTGDVGDSYGEITKKLKDAHGKLIPIALFMRSVVPDTISMHRPHERVDRRSADFKRDWINGKV